MKSFYNLILLGGVATALVCPSQGALANTGGTAKAETKTAAGKQQPQTTGDPKFDEINRTGYDRSLGMGAHNVIRTPAVKTPAVKDVFTKGTPVVKTPVVKLTPVKTPAVKTPVVKVGVAQPTKKMPQTTITRTLGNPNSAAVTPKSDIIRVSTKSPTSFITAWLDRPGINPKYKIGEKLVVNVSSTVDCNVVVFNYDAKGNLTQIFPNELQKEGRLKSGQNIQIGGEDSPFDYKVAGDGGVERIFVYAYPTNQSGNPITVAMAPTKTQSPFLAKEKVSMSQYLAMVRDAQVFTTRGVEVIPKKTVQNASAKADDNKLELTFQVEQ